MPLGIVTGNVGHAYVRHIIYVLRQMPRRLGRMMRFHAGDPDPLAGGGLLEPCETGGRNAVAMSGLACLAGTNQILRDYNVALWINWYGKCRIFGKLLNP